MEKLIASDKLIMKIKNLPEIVLTFCSILYTRRWKILIKYKIFARILLQYR